LVLGCLLWAASSLWSLAGRSPHGGSDAPTAAEGDRVKLQIDVHRAPVAELKLLPGVGPTLAARIAEFVAEHGPLENAEQLLEVHGVGPLTLEAIRPYLVVHGGERPPRCPESEAAATMAVSHDGELHGRHEIGSRRIPAAQPLPARRRSTAGD
jgi:competence ComEA-like helix-hairpin-helix protein